MRRFAPTQLPWAAPRAGVRGMMGLVLLALLPGVAAQTWFFGPGVLLQLVLAVTFAMLVEAAMLTLRRQPLRAALGDLSAPTTAVLFALCVPPLAPWWVALVGMLAAIVFAKHLYGGLGHNLFNPAMVGYVVVLVSFPRELSQWLPPAGTGAHPGLADTLTAVFGGRLPDALQWDAITRATPLDALRAATRAGETLSELRVDPVFGVLGGRGWEWIAGLYALGGLFLLWRRVIDWRVPMAIIATIVVLTLPAWLWDPDVHPAPLQHLFLGATMLVAFFVATEPVTGCATPRGRLLFGVGVAVIALSIRRWGQYPDGMAFAVLLMNAAAPWLDRVTGPRAHGAGPRRRPTKELP